MGSLCSKSTNYEGGHTVLGSGNDGNSAGESRPAPPPSDARTAAALAAERRLQAAQKRGTNDANPNQGKLAGQLAKQSNPRANPQNREDDRLVWD